LLTCICKPNHKHESVFTQQLLMIMMSAYPTDCLQSSATWYMEPHFVSYNGFSCYSPTLQLRHTVCEMRNVCQMLTVAAVKLLPLSE